METKKMKQLFLSLMFMLLPLSANSDTVKIDGIYYNLITERNTAEVTGRTGREYTGNVDIPSIVTYEGRSTA